MKAHFIGKEAENKENTTLQYVPGMNKSRKDTYILYIDVLMTYKRDLVYTYLDRVQMHVCSLCAFRRH